MTVTNNYTLPFIGCKTTTVFDISHTDGKDLPSVTTELNGNDYELYDRLKQLAVSQNVELTVDESKAGGSVGLDSPS